MGYQAVLLPFPMENSEKQLLSTKGGLTSHAPVDVVEKHRNNFAKAKELKAAARIRLESDGVEEGSPEFESEMSKLAPHFAKVRANYREAKAMLAAETKPGWRGIPGGAIICADSPNLTAVLRQLRGPDDVLYIRGHCSAGSGTLSSSDSTLAIDAGELVDLLEEGLSTSFSGRIKVFACESAVNMWRRKSFATRFADELVDRGYVRARVFGYTSDLKTWTDSEGHKRTKDGTRASEVAQEVPTTSRKGCCVVS